MRKWAQASIPMWRRALGFGMLWAVAITFGEALNYPLEQMSTADQASALVYIFQSWVVIGVGVAWSALVAEERRMAWWISALQLVLIGVAASAINDLFFPISMGHRHALGERLPSRTLFYYILWMTLFHGALFTAGCRFAMRAERFKQALASARIARGQTEALLVDAQLAALRARIEPAFLVKVMDEVRQRYETDPPAADRLVDQLVAFLRTAMPGVRGDDSTLAAELQLVKAYALVSAEIDPLHRAWTFHTGQGVPNIEFPALLLLPLVEHMAPTHPDDLGGELSLISDPDGWALTIARPGATTCLPAALVYRTRVALHAKFGDACKLRINTVALPHQPVLTLGLPPCAPAAALASTLVTLGEDEWTPPASTTPTTTTPASRAPMNCGACS